MFWDKAVVYFKAGDGGKGIVSFSHEKYKEKGGPDGGDGGRGGDIILKTNPNISTLSYFASHKRIVAENGEQGKNKKGRGKSASNLVLEVPQGTIIFDQSSGEKLIDLIELNQNFCIARGGEGGFGNAHFTSSTRQIPKIAELGEPGEERLIRLELKLIAEIGIIGLPNVGKSTLLSVISEAHPKIADYPFTTLVPNLGVVKGDDFEFVVADIPGLIEGAAKGKGLGIEFLRHIERTKILVHLLSATSQNIAKDFFDVSKELGAYSKELLKKPQIVVVNKIDVLDKENKSKITKGLSKILKEKNILNSNKPIFISAVTHQSIKELIYFISQTLKKLPKKTEKEKEEFKLFTLADIEKGFDIQKKGNIFIVSGEKIERFAQKTDFSSPHSVLRLYDILKKTGIQKALMRFGAEEGDILEIKDKKLKYKSPY